MLTGITITIAMAILFLAATHEKPATGTLSGGI